MCNDISSQILRCAQDDNLQGICHPERSEGSRADSWVSTRIMPTYLLPDDPAVPSWDR